MSHQKLLRPKITKYLRLIEFQCINTNLYKERSKRKYFDECFNGERIK